MNIYKDGDEWHVWDGATRSVFDTEAQARVFSLTGASLSAADAALEAIRMSRDSEYVAAVKSANERIWDGINELLALQRQWNALDYGNTLAVEGVVPSEVGAVVFDTATALAGVLAAGHATNMAKLL